MPFALVVVGVDTPVATLIAVTVAPDTTAPVESVTVPVTLPVMVCANVARGLVSSPIHSAMKHDHRNEFFRILPPNVSSRIEVHFKQQGSAGSLFWHLET